MKKQNRSPTIAVEVAVYDKTKARAQARGMTLQDYVHEILLINLERNDFLRRYAPHIEAVTVGDTIVLRDHKIDKIAEIYLKNGTLYCSQDESNDCMHIHFALAMPEVIKVRGKGAK